MLRIFIVIASVLAIAASQCGSADNARCSTWISSGFCTNTVYTLQQRQAYCGTACGLCSSSTSSACAGKTDDSRCASWVKNGFCSNAAYTTAQINQYCCNACASSTTSTTTLAPPSTTCAAIYDASGVVVNATPSTSAAMINPTNLTQAYVLTGCTLQLYTDPFAQTPAQSSPITGASTFTTLTGTDVNSVTYICSCP